MGSNNRRCSDCEVISVDPHRCEKCGDLVCDDCMIDHPCNWYDDGLYEEENEGDD